MRKLLLTGLAVLGLSLTSCDKKQEQIDQLNDDLRLSEAQVEALRVKLGEANDAIADYQSVIATLEGTNADLLVQLSEAEALAADLSIELDAANADNDALNAQVAELEAMLAETQAELDRTIAEAAAQAAADQVEINSLLERISVLEADAEANAAEIAELKALLGAADAQLVEVIQNIRDNFLFLYAPSLDTDGDTFSNILYADGTDTGFDLNDEGLTDEMLLDSFRGFAAKFGE